MGKDKFNEKLKELATQKQSVIAQTKKLEEKKNNRILSLDPKDPNYKAFEPQIKTLNDEIKADEKKIEDSKKKIESELSSAKNSKKKELDSRAGILAKVVKIEEDKVKEEVEKIEKAQEELTKKRSETVKKIQDLKKKKGSNDPNIDVNAIDGEIATLETDVKKYANQQADNDLSLTFLNMSKQQLMDEYMEIKDEILKVKALTYDDFDKEFIEKEEKPVEQQTQTQNQVQPQGQPYQYYGQPVYGGYAWPEQQPMQPPVQPNVPTQNNVTRATQEVKQPIAPKPTPKQEQESPLKNNKIEVKLNDDGTITYKCGDINATYKWDDYKAAQKDIIARAERRFPDEGKGIARERIEPLLMKFILEKVKDGQAYNEILSKYMNGEQLDKKFAQYDMRNLKPATFFLSKDVWTEVAEKAVDSGLEVTGYITEKQKEQQKKEAKARKDAKKDAKKENELPKGFTYKEFCKKCEKGENPLGEKWDKIFKALVDNDIIDKAEVEQEKEKIYNSLLQEVRKQMKDTKTVDVKQLLRNSANWSEKEIKESGNTKKISAKVICSLFDSTDSSSKVFEYIKGSLDKKEKTQINIKEIEYMKWLEDKDKEEKKKTRGEFRNNTRVNGEELPDELKFTNFATKTANGEKPLGAQWGKISMKNGKVIRTIQKTYENLMRVVISKMKDSTRPISTQAIYDLVKSQMGDFTEKYTNADGNEVYLEEELLNSVLDDKDGLKKMLEYAKTGLSKEEQEKVDIDEIKSISEEKEEKEEKEKEKEEEQRTNAG